MIHGRETYALPIPCFELAKGLFIGRDEEYSEFILAQRLVTSEIYSSKEIFPLSLSLSLVQWTVKVFLSDQ